MKRGLLPANDLVGNNPLFCRLFFMDCLKIHPAYKNSHRKGGNRIKIVVL